MVEKYQQAILAASTTARSGAITASASARCFTPRAASGRAGGSRISGAASAPIVGGIWVPVAAVSVVLSELLLLLQAAR